MIQFWLGLAVIPAIALAGALIWVTWGYAARIYHDHLDPSLTDGKHAYAYQVTSATGYMANQLIGATFTESRYRGHEYTYRLEFNGVEKVRLTAKYKGHGQGFGSWADWDQQTAEELDKLPGGSDA